MKREDGIVMIFYSIERFIFVHNFKFLANIFFRLIYSLFNCYIPSSLEISIDPKFLQGIGIVIHHDCKIGEGTVIYQNVTIGGGRNIEIGKNCLIGVNSVILGPSIKIGNNVKIGTLSFVNFNVHDYKTVTEYE